MPDDHGVQDLERRRQLQKVIHLVFGETPEEQVAGALLPVPMMAVGASKGVSLFRSVVMKALKRAEGTPIFNETILHFSNKYPRLFEHAFPELAPKKPPVRPRVYPPYTPHEIPPSPSQNWLRNVLEGEWPPNPKDTPKHPVFDTPMKFVDVIEDAADESVGDLAADDLTRLTGEPGSWGDTVGRLRRWLTNVLKDVGEK